MTNILAIVVLWTVTTNWTEPIVITPTQILWNNKYSSPKDSRISYREVGVISSNKVLYAILDGKTNEVSKVEKQYRYINHDFHWHVIKKTDKIEEMAIQPNEIFLDFNFSNPLIPLQGKPSETM